MNQPKNIEEKSLRRANPLTTSIIIYQVYCQDH